MTDLTNILGGVFTLSNKRVDPPEVQLRNAILDAGLDAPEDIYIDNQVHRFRPGTKGKAGEDKAGWYIAFPSAVPGAVFGCWRSGIQQNWKADIGRQLTSAEEMAYLAHIAEARKKAEAERKRRQEQAADTVGEIWDQRGDADPEHPYLARKGVQPHGVRITGDGRLMVPMVNADGELVSLQYISHDGTKRYHSGGQAGGAYWCIGQTTEAGPVYLAEGFATAATIHEETKRPCYVAFSAHNLPAVAEIIRRTHNELVIVADNDASGVGASHAYEAAAKHGARVVIPPNEGTDANDFVASGGDLSQLLAADSTGWLVQADSFSKQPAPLRWFIKHWIQQDALVMIHGPSGGGKTFAVLDMCLHVAAGLPEWQGNKVKPGTVVYLAGEGHHGLRGRIAGWKQHNGVDTLNMWLSSSGCDFNTPEGYGKAAAAVRSLPTAPSIVIIDTLHRFMSGDENSAQDAKSMLDHCADLMAEFGCTVILVHHTGVSDEAQHRARGSSAWRGALDIEISVVPGSDTKPVEIRQRKAKDSEEADSIYVTLDSLAIDGWLDEDGEPVTTAVLASAEKPKAGRKETEITEHLKRIESAWFSSGCEDIKGQPYITRSALTAKLEEHGLAATTIKTYLNPAKDRMIAKLLSREMIAAAKDGWIITDQNTASAWMAMRKKA